jgi:hypothetical protein
MQPTSPRPGYFGRTLDLGLLDRIMMTQDAVLPTRDIIFGATLARGGFEVKRPLVKDGESWQRGAAESRQRAQTEMHTRGGGAFWRLGGVIGRTNKVYTDLNLEDGSVAR